MGWDSGTNQMVSCGPFRTRLNTVPIINSDRAETLFNYKPGSIAVSMGCLAQMSFWIGMSK